MICCHDEKQNKNFKYYANFEKNIENVMTKKFIEQKMKIRLKNLQGSRLIKYINDEKFEIDDEQIDNRKTKICI